MLSPESLHPRLGTGTPRQGNPIPAGPAPGARSFEGSFRMPLKSLTEFPLIAELIAEAKTSRGTLLA